jgi:hypothetical protein
MTRREFRIGILLSVAVVLVWASGAVLADGSNPPGNNGTVKIDNYGNGNDVAPNNEPHVQCTFGTDSYGYEASALSGAEAFNQHPPTSGGGTAVAPQSAGTSTLKGTNARGTGRTYNGSDSPTLSLVGDPHPKQGYHVKLTYDAPDGNSNGSTLKHKVFWVQPCPAAPVPGGPAPAGPAPSGPGHGPGGPAVPEVVKQAVAANAPALQAPKAGPARAVRGKPAFTG